MCGIAGAIGVIDAGVEAAVRSMTNAQEHRGPDDSGFYSSGQGTGVALGFRRLAIIDLSSAGAQPMRDPERGNVVVFNGEIYNHAELRAELTELGERFHSTSDTEVLLRAYGRWGEDAVARLRGMFAFAIFDSARKSVLLARDRLGIKPLYVAEVTRSGERLLLFASELRAVLASGLVPRRLDPAAVSSYLWNGFVVGPPTMIRGISLLPPGTTATLRLPDTTPRPRSYWSLAALSPTTHADAEERLEDELLTAARQHLVSDVPLGVFLSGGIDSSAVTTLAVRANGAHVKTFHVGFDEAKFDESNYARAVAQSLGTEHSEFRLTQALFQSDLERALLGLDQPTFDALNTYFVSRVVRDAGFTVALAGTGGDELFGGYRSFRDIPRARTVAGAARVVPRGVRALISRMAARAVAPVAGEVPPQTRWAKAGNMLESGGDPLVAYQVAYALFTRDFQAELATKAVLEQCPDGLPVERVKELVSAIEGKSALGAVSICELALFIGERLLRDSDAASMAVSLELRVPLLDHRVVEAACSVPDRQRFRPLGKKRLLRAIAMPKLPADLFDRPKAGFVLPIEVWARDRLAPEIEATLADAKLSASIGLNSEALQRLFRAFKSGAPGLYWSRVWAPYVLLRWCKTHGVALG